MIFLFVDFVIDCDAVSVMILCLFDIVSSDIVLVWVQFLRVLMN